MIKKWSTYWAVVTVAALLSSQAVAQQTADPRLEGSWRWDGTPETMNVSHSISGWSATSTTMDPPTVMSASGEHLVVVTIDSRVFVGLQQRYELDLSSDGNHLVGKLQTYGGNLQTWMDGDRNMRWVSVSFSRIQ